jgi:tetratricopeptide (TPR) repeat protein
MVVAFGGYTLLFYGYVEHYSLMLAAVSILLMLGTMIAQRKLNKFWIVIPATVAPLLHLIALVFWPAVIYILLRDTGIGRAIGGWPSARKRTAAIVIFAGALAAFILVYMRSSIFFRLVFLPLTATEYTPEGYTLLSLNHILDVINLLIVLVPALPLFVWLAVASRGQELHRPQYKFLALAIVGSFLAVFMLDPKIGMPRDVDLFSFAGLPLALGGALLLLSGMSKSRANIYPAILVVLLTLWISVPRFVAWSSDSIGLAHFQSYLVYDKLKNRAARHLLVNYYREKGDEAAAETETKRWQEEFPAVSLAARSTEMSDQGHYNEAIALNHEAIRLDPIFWVSYFNLGSCFNAIRQFDSAIYYFEICDGLNPNNSQLLNNLGYAYSRTGKFDQAIQKFQRCFEIDSTAVAALVNLMDIKKNAGDNNAFYRYLQIGLEKFPNSPQVMQQLGDYLVIRQQFDQARVAYDSAMVLGLNPGYVENIKKLFPQLYPEAIEDSTLPDRQ